MSLYNNLITKLRASSLIVNEDGRGLGVSGSKTRTCFLTSGYSLTDNYFQCMSTYVLIGSVSSEWSNGPQTSAQVSDGIPVPGRNSTSGTVFTSRPSRARDLVTMVEGGPTLGRVKTGVGSVSRGAGTEPNSPDRSV